LPSPRAVYFIVLHAPMVGDHFAVLIHGREADNFRKGERTREQLTDLMAGGETMADLEAGLSELQASAQG
jgi:simple sugar transport system ATP-binding protein